MGIITGTLAFAIGMLLWCTQGSLSTYAVIWSIVFLTFLVVLMVLFFIGGKGRIKEVK